MIATQKTIKESIDALHRNNNALAKERVGSNHDQDLISMLIKQNYAILLKLLRMVTP